MKKKQTASKSATKIETAKLGLVKQTLGLAQKRLTLIEGQAREFVTSTWSRVRAVRSLQAVEETIESLRKRYDQELDVAKLRQAAEQFSSQKIDSALHTVGIATQADIQSVERKLNQLRSDVRKIGRKGAGRTKAKTPKNRGAQK
jgi:hypothetical protein